MTSQRLTSDSDEQIRFDKHPFLNENQLQVDPLPISLIAPVTSNHTMLGLDTYELDYDKNGNRPPKYKRLELLNRGTHNGKWGNQRKQRREDDWYLCQIIANQVGLPESLKDSVDSAYNSLDLRTFKQYEGCTGSSGGMDKQYLVVFCLCALIYNKYCPDDRRYYPNKQVPNRKKYGAGLRFAGNLTDSVPSDTDEELHKFADSMGFSDTDIKSCMEKLRGRCPRFYRDEAS